MNIIVITDSYLPSMTTLSLTVFNTVSILEKKGHQVLVITRSSGHQSYEEKGILYLKRKEQKKLTSSLKERILAFKVDLIHSFSSLFEPLVKDLYEQLHVPMIKTLNHGQEATNADEVIVSSLQEKEQLRKNNPSLYLNVFPSEIDLTPFRSFHCSKEKITAFKEQYDLHEESKVMLIISPLNKRSQVSQLLKLYFAFRHKNQDLDTRLFIIGEGEMRKELELLVHSFHFANEVFFIGAVSYDKLPFYFSFSSLYLSINKEKEEVMCLFATSSGGTYLIYSPDLKEDDHTFYSENTFVDHASFLFRNESESFPLDVREHEIENYYQKLMEVYNHGKRKRW